MKVLHERRKPRKLVMYYVKLMAVDGSRLMLKLCLFKLRKERDDGSRLLERSH